MWSQTRLAALRRVAKDTHAQLTQLSHKARDLAQIAFDECIAVRRREIEEALQAAKERIGLAIAEEAEILATHTTLALDDVRLAHTGPIRRGLNRADEYIRSALGLTELDDPFFGVDVSTVRELTNAATE